MNIIYNLYSNSLDSKPEYLRKFKPFNIRWEIIEYIKLQVDQLFESENVLTFNNLLKEVYEIGENIRSSNVSLAHEMYMTLFYELTCTRYKGDSKIKQRELAFSAKLDFTEIYYNLAKLKWDSGDYDNAIYYIVHADVQYSKHNNQPRCTFVKFLLNSRRYVLWNVIPHLNSAFSNYKSSFNISRIRDIIAGEINELIIQQLLNDFEMLHLLQFINSINRFHNFLGEQPNEYKTLREYRILSELSWLFECYLKDKFKVSNMDLYNLIHKHLLANSKELLRIFDSYNSLPVPSNTGKEARKTKEYYEESLEHMFKELNAKSDPLEIATICIRITYLYRNYSSHNVEDRFFKFDKDNRSKGLYLVILSSFIVAYKLIESVNK